MSACVFPSSDWTRRGDGYCVRNIGGNVVYAHRVAWVEENGDIAAGISLHHQCKNRSCINLDHLEAMTQSEHLTAHLLEKHHNREKTHCPRGHPYTGRNLLIKARKGGAEFRQCRICSNLSSRNAKRRKRLKLQSKSN